MAAQVVITQPTARTPALGGLFGGLAFFLVQRVPMRSTYIARIQANGGRVVKLEAQADHVIADHLRDACPAASISYTFIDAAIHTGTLPDPQAHAAGAPRGTQREAGSGAPVKGTRTPFTAEDDRVLWRWVRDSKGPVKGNEIYKQLEATNARHTWQAWRDRYVKRLMDKPPVGREVVVPANPPPSPPTAPDEQAEIVAQVDGAEEAVEAEVETARDEADGNEDGFTEEEIDLLLEQGHDIQSIADDREDEAWSAWAQAYAKHSADAWRRFWREEVRPIYLKRMRDTGLADEEAREAKVDEGENHPADVERPDELATSEHQMEQIETMPLSSQKRKRPATSLAAERTYGKKKRKSYNDEIFVRVESDRESRPEAGVADHILPTSELDRQARMQLERETQEGVDSALPVVDSVEDAQAEAQAEFDEEVLGIPRKHIPVEISSMSNVPTSDFNRAADQQLRRESLDRKELEEDEDESSELKTPSNLSEDGDDGESIHSQKNPVAPSTALETPSARLTEANLASQQAQHKAQLLRGADLPEDSDAQDADQQEEYIHYLRNLTGRAERLDQLPAMTFATQAPVAAIESQLPRDGLPIIYDPVDPDGGLGELSMTAQQEIDGVLEDLIEWSPPPVIAQRRPPPLSQSQSVQLETQLPYPSLPAQPGLESRMEEEEMFSSQPPLEPEVSYPSLPEPGKATSEESMSSQRDVKGEVEVDFSVPPPLGGWSSSPAKGLSSQATPIASRQHFRVKQESQKSANSQPEPRIAAAQEVVELSSTSSSSLSSSDEEEADPTPVPSAGPCRRRALETQDILEAETQQPDFDLPPPPDSEYDSDNLSSDASIPSSPAHPDGSESQRALVDTQRLDDDGLEEFVTRMTTVHGYSETSVITALKCTSARPELAKLVLLDEKAGKGLPTDVPGVWSEAEDRVIEGGSAAAMRRLEEKHSWREMNERLQFLDEWREA